MTRPSTRCAAQLVAQPDGSPIRLAKPTSNLFRFREPPPDNALDVSAFAGVIDMNQSTPTGTPPTSAA